MRNLRIITLVFLVICLLFAKNALTESWHLSMHAKGQGLQVSGIEIGMDMDSNNQGVWPPPPPMPNFAPVINILDPNTEEYYYEDVRPGDSLREDWYVDIFVGNITPVEGDPNSGSVADANQPGFFPSISWNPNNIASNGFMQIRLGNSNGPIVVSNMKTTSSYQATQNDALATGGYNPEDNIASMRYKVTFSACDVDIPQDIDMIPGWNWVSFYVLPDDTSLESFFGDNADLIDQVTTQTRSAKYRDGVWRGDDLNLMSNISKGITFKIKAITSFTLSVTGLRLPQDMPIDLYLNWTWVAYLPDSVLSVEDVVSSIFDDFHQVTSQTASKLKKADGSLRGDLMDMEPGKGYLVNMEAPGFLIYP